MKRVTELKSVLVSLVIVVSLSACGENSDTSNEPGPTSKLETSESKIASDRSPPDSDETASGLPPNEPGGFAQCKVCHSVEEDGPAGVGPNLHGIFGKTAASKEGFSFSPAFKESKIKWNEQELDAFLESPATLVPGTKMAFAGLSDPKTREEIVRYLQSLQ